MRRTLPLLLTCVVALHACSEEGLPPPPDACVSDPAAVARALTAAPGEVTLPDGTRLSECVRHARSDADLQSVGLVLTGVAEDLEAEAPEDPRSALRLGYLVGAARRGAPGDSSLQFELVQRLERSAGADLPPEAQRALEEGLRAGEERG